ncbi:Outer membrane protein omp85 precursor [Candidatus Ornithobacterium hominis]|uniref:Outer membrane protein omp85 n=1 Tax=Candidatus Ornithobacterium hominis TaxID=2497989 RepID=A0A383TTF9_9FLAO|nr:POTRA domain-containing protein [Candidatus Ornithobacterium hominis]MCT7903607.1 BamA/TamA family outer membrane protein [Candidatus Ornithobacterium hominis]SZD70944.1 Outer membrane protein omp85 precursor [Candidatus Ornithobacterium hominis]SZD71497.1 Outer membrane protein omp85 precursor [Candidatus Ornithobacterium hominis]
MKRNLFIFLFSIFSLLQAQVDSLVTDSTKLSLDLEKLQTDGNNFNPQVKPQNHFLPLSGRYVLGGIEIVGGVPYTSKQILNFTGLQIGESIDLRGNELNNAIKKLWKTSRFSEVEVYLNKVEEGKAYLIFNLEGVPSIHKVEFIGVKKSAQEDFVKNNELKPGVKITQNLLNQTRLNIKKHYTEKGYPDAIVNISHTPAEGRDYTDILTINVDRGKRIKIQDIIFEGNQVFSDSKLRRKALKETKRKGILRKYIFQIFKGSKLIPEKYEEDLGNLIEFYKSYGYRDAKVVWDSISRTENNDYLIEIGLDEGNQYYLGNVNFIGNSVYDTELLNRIFGYKKGDPYDAVGIEKKLSSGDRDDNVITLYQDNGYLFSRVIPVEKSVVNDTINLDIIIQEGSQARWNYVTFDGNTQTHDHVIAREIYTKPGELFSKTDLKRTYINLGQLGYFDPQQITYDIQPNQESNTVDVKWGLTPQSSSQVELQGGYGGGRFIGTLGLSFKNFSLKNLLKGKHWKPVPLGDGQTLSLRAQAGSYFSNFSFSFIEPWIGGSRPTALSISIYNSNYKNLYQNDESRLTIWGASLGLNKLLTWPDNYFRLSNSVSYQRYDFKNYGYNIGSIRYRDGQANNLAYQIGLSRQSTGDPIFPKSGSDFNVSLKLTPPYSLLNNKDYKKLKEEGNFESLYKWLEYYKVQFSGNWYKEIIGKLVLRTGAEFGFMGAYNKTIGVSPFERFFMGGTGLQANRFDGREIIPLRGYEDFTDGGGGKKDITPLGGGTIYDKFLLELRYPITMGQQAKIFGLGFIEAGNTWDNSSSFQPFELKRSAGVGVRVFMSAFGMLGFDFGYGFDQYPNSAGKPSGWQTHFIFGQSL